jgi:hypothetical protein
MRLITRLGVMAALAVAALMPVPPAQAAQSGSIRVGATTQSAVRSYWYMLKRCDPAALAQVNNTDAAVFDVGNRPVGSTVSVKWTGVIAPGGVLIPQLLNAECSPITTGATGSLSGTGPSSGTINIRIPAPARWLMIEGFAVANVALTVP